MNSEIFLNGLIPTLIASLVVAIPAWIANSRRLFLSVSGMLHHSELSAKGSTVELSFQNKGLKTENNVVANISPVVSWQVLARSTDHFQISDNAISLNRIAPQSHESIILLVENSELKKECLELSSETTKGRVQYTSGADLTRNQIAATGFTICIAFIFLVHTAWREFELGRAHGELDFYQSLGEPTLPPALINAGWSGGNVFSIDPNFDLSDELSFPISMSAVTRVGNIASSEVTITNTFPTNITVLGKFISQYEIPHDDLNLREILLEKRYFEEILILPNHSFETTMSVFVPEHIDTTTLRVMFHLKSGNQFIAELNRDIQLPDF